jgi:hypothetical protein
MLEREMSALSPACSTTCWKKPDGLLGCGSSYHYAGNQHKDVAQR